VPANALTKSTRAQRLAGRLSGGVVNEIEGRTVALDAGTVAVLRAYRKQQLEERLKWGSAWVDSGRAFTREDGAELFAKLLEVREVDLIDGFARNTKLRRAYC
jgi:hypothetical protein